MCHPDKIINGTHQLHDGLGKASKAAEDRLHHKGKAYVAYANALQRRLLARLRRSQRENYDWASRQATKFAIEQAKWATEYKAKMMRERSLKRWLGPLCLPMLLVIHPFAWYNIRTILVLMVLAFVVWIQYKRRGGLKRAWVRGLEKHCDKCMNVLLTHVNSKPHVRWDVRSLRRAPLRMLSRHWGVLANTVMPSWLAVIVLWCYVRLFSVKLHEAERDSLWQYDSLGDFFTRKLKAGMRPICLQSELVSPCDGRVTFCGKYTGGFLQQVKGVHYSLNYFLGLDNADGSHQRVHAANGDFGQRLLHRQAGTALYQCVIYLAPGDYHRFHSPAEWAVEKRRHFPGELLSVKPGMVASFPGLFHMNERVAWLGRWKHGFFSMTAVGATNVGSIHSEFEPDLRTNQAATLKRELTMASACSRRHFHFSERCFSAHPVQRRAGQDFGHFNFGSTLVLLFEAPDDGFSFKELSDSGRVRVGQGLHRLEH